MPVATVQSHIQSTLITLMLNPVWGGIKKSENKCAVVTLHSRENEIESFSLCESGVGCPLGLPQLG